MADYTFNTLLEPLKNNNTIQTVLDIDALAAPAKAALAGYVASLQLPTAQAQHLTWENVGVAVLIQSLNLTYYLPSLGSQTPAPSLKRTSTLRDRVIEMQSLESKFPKCQMLIFGKNAGETDWIWLNTETIQNSGNRVNTLKLVPYLSQSDSFVPGRKTQIGIQFIADPVSNATLPQAGDRLTVQCSVHLDVNPIGTDSKKNDEVNALETRLAVLETLLQPFGAATETAAGTTGLVGGAAVGESEFLLRGDRQWQNPAEFVSSSQNQTVNGSKIFSQMAAFLKEVVSSGVGSLSAYASRTAATLFSTGANSYLSLSASDAPANSKLVYLELSSAGIVTFRRLNDTYSSAVSNIFLTDTVNNLRLPGFTTLGSDVAVKIKKLSGVTAAAQGNAMDIAHGIDGTKIIACNLIVNYAANTYLGPNYIDSPGYEINLVFSGSNISIRNKANNSVNVLSKPFTCLLIYTN